MNEETLFVVARLYYEEQKTQEEISQQIGVSRSTVSRLLNEAVKKHVITIRVNYPWHRDQELERQLSVRFGLREVRVLDDRGKDPDSILRGVGALAARIFEDQVKDGDIVAVSYGRTVANVVAALSPQRQVRVTAVPLLGALGVENTAIDGTELVRQFAAAYGGDYRYIPGPLLVKDERTRNGLIQLPQIAQPLTLARRAKWTLVGVGAITESGMIWSGYLNRKSLDRIKAMGAVGHMSGQFFNERGRILAESVNRRTIGVGLKSLASRPGVIAIAAGREKAEAIRGALLGKYADCLVTDFSAASAILDLD